MTYYDPATNKYWRWKWLKYRALRWSFVLITLPAMILCYFGIGMWTAAKWFVEEMASAK